LRVYSTLGLSRRGEDMEIQDNGTLIISRAAVRNDFNPGEKHVFIFHSCFVSYILLEGI